MCALHFNGSATHYVLGSCPWQLVPPPASSEAKCAHAAGAKTAPPSSPCSFPVLIKCTALHAFHAFKALPPPMLMHRCSCNLLPPTAVHALCSEHFIHW